MAIDAARAAETHLPRILGVSAAFHAFALILVACRVYTRACLVKSFGKDDALIITGALCTLGGGMIILIVEGQHGLGHHTDTLSDDDIMMYNMLSWVQSLLVSSIGMASIKVSVGCSLLRLSTNKRFRQLIHGLIGFTCFYWALGCLSVVLYCQPIKGLWNHQIGASCYPESVYIRLGFFNTACNIFTDICFATAPLPLIWSLKLDRRVQLYLVAIFSLGYLAVAMAVAKAVCQAAFWTDADRTFDHWIQFFGFLEANVSLMAASLLPLARARRHRGGARRRRGRRQQQRDAPATSFDIEAELGLRGSRSHHSNSHGGMGGFGGENPYRSSKCWSDPEQAPPQFGPPHDGSDESGADSAPQTPSEYAAQFLNGSQEMILPDVHSKRDSIIIMKTTEVTVSRT
ncbi:uncharacterized protein PG986_002149 [Apiospora aurea]|uniref:Rhodopsin domain-containing protein n=1 Tax=Apiospora aurea TaxID=335848 RepID=A0ABR1QYU0_9PEZI